MVPEREGGLGPRQHCLLEMEEFNGLQPSYKGTGIFSNEGVTQRCESRGFYAQHRQELGASLGLHGPSEHLQPELILLSVALGQIN